MTFTVLFLFWSIKRIERICLSSLYRWRPHHFYNFDEIILKLKILRTYRTAINRYDAVNKIKKFKAHIIPPNVHQNYLANDYKIYSTFRGTPIHSQYFVKIIYRASIAWYIQTNLNHSGPKSPRFSFEILQQLEKLNSIIDTYWTSMAVEKNSNFQTRILPADFF